MPTSRPPRAPRRRARRSPRPCARARRRRSPRHRLVAPGGGAQEDDRGRGSARAPPRPSRRRRREPVVDHDDVRASSAQAPDRRAAVADRADHLDVRRAERAGTRETSAVDLVVLDEQHADRLGQRRSLRDHEQRVVRLPPVVDVDRSTSGCRRSSAATKPSSGGASSPASSAEPLPLAVEHAVDDLLDDRRRSSSPKRPRTSSDEPEVCTLADRDAVELRVARRDGHLAGRPPLRARRASPLVLLGRRRRDVASHRREPGLHRRRRDHARRASS